MCPEQLLPKNTKGITKVFTETHSCKPTSVCYLWGGEKIRPVVSLRILDSLYLYWAITLRQRCCPHTPLLLHLALPKRIPHGATQSSL